jgi:preprotein translocase subunit YajC
LKSNNLKGILSEKFGGKRLLIEIAYAMGQAPQGGQSGGFGAILTSLTPLIFIFVIFYFLLIRPQKKKADEHKAMLANLKKGDKVITQGGIYGVIDSLDTTTITLKVAENVKMKFSRSAVSGLRNNSE